MYRLNILDSASRELAALDRPVALRVSKKLRWLAENFDGVRPEPLGADLSDFYKLRVGDYRAIYAVIRDERLLVVHAVGHRSEIDRRT